MLWHTKQVFTVLGLHNFVLILFSTFFDQCSKSQNLFKIFFFSKLSLPGHPHWSAMLDPYTRKLLSQYTMNHQGHHHHQPQQPPFLPPPPLPPMGPGGPEMLLFPPHQPPPLPPPHQVIYFLYLKVQIVTEGHKNLQKSLILF